MRWAVGLALGFALLGAACAPAQPQPAPEQLCGRSFADVAELSASLRADRSYRESPGPESEDRRALLWLNRSEDGFAEEWLIAPAGHPFHPAASCSQRRRTSAGRWTRRREISCAASAEACTQFDLFLRRRDLLPSVPMPE